MTEKDNTTGNPFKANTPDLQKRIDDYYQISEMIDADASHADLERRILEQQNEDLRIDGITPSA
jgi:hypothetical protein